MENPAVDTPKSSPWVPSYSVSSQGASPLHSPNVAAIAEAELELVEPLEAQAAVEVTETINEQAPEVEHLEEVEVTTTDVAEEVPSIEIVAEAPSEEPTAEPSVVVTAEADATEVGL